MKYVRNQWDRVGASLCIAGGLIALFVGYLGVSDTLDTGEQMPYIVSGGMTGLFLLGLGALLWLSADLRDEWRKLDAIDRHLADGGSSAAQPPPAPAGSKSEGNGTVVPREVSLR